MNNDITQLPDTREPETLHRLVRPTRADPYQQIRVIAEMKARNQAQLIKSLVAIVIHETDQAQRKGRVRSVRLSNTEATEPDNLKRTYLRALLLAALQEEEPCATRKRFRRSLTMITATRA